MSVFFLWNSDPGMKLTYYYFRLHLWRILHTWGRNINPPPAWP